MRVSLIGRARPFGALASSRSAAATGAGTVLVHHRQRVRGHPPIRARRRGKPAKRAVRDTVRIRRAGSQQRPTRTARPRPRRRRLSYHAAAPAGSAPRPIDSARAWCAPSADPNPRRGGTARRPPTHPRARLASGRPPLFARREVDGGRRVAGGGARSNHADSGGVKRALARGVTSRGARHRGRGVPRRRPRYRSNAATDFDRARADAGEDQIALVAQARALAARRKGDRRPRSKGGPATARAAARVDATRRRGRESGRDEETRPRDSSSE